MALGDNFNAYTDGQPLDSESADWDVWLASGTGVMTLDQHDDHSDLSQVVDMSDVGDNFAIYQTQVGSNDHFCEADCFVDDDADSANQVGPIVRGSASSMGSSTFNGYMAQLEAVDPSNERLLRIYRIDNDAATLLASSADITGQPYESKATPATIRLEISGDALTAYADGNELVSTTDSTHSTGQFVGLRMNRATAGASSQPFIDNFAGDVLGAAAETVTLAGTLPALSGSFDTESSADVALAGTLPALTGSFTIAEPGVAPPMYISVTVGPMRSPLDVATMRDPLQAGTISGVEPVTVGALTDSTPTVGVLRDDSSPTVGVLREPLTVDTMRDPLQADELRE